MQGRWSEWATDGRGRDWRFYTSWLLRNVSWRMIRFPTRRNPMPTDRTCEYCARRFTVSRKDRVFCSTACRVRYHREISLTCYYCGELADTKDHVFPQTFGGTETVNACLTCNTTLGARFPESHIHRIEYLIVRTTARHKLDSPMPEWADEELLELGHNLQQAVRGKIHARQRAMQRVLFMQARLYKLKCE